MKKMVLAILLNLILVGSAFADSHSTTGVITGMEDNGKVLVISHQEFPGFMGAMTMPFQLQDSALSAGLNVGDEIEFTIKKTETGYPIVELKKIGGS